MLHVIRRPFGSVDASTIVVEGFSVVIGYNCLLQLRSTARVLIETNVTVRGLEFRGLVAASNFTPRRCMHRDAVLTAVVHSFQNV